MRRFCPLFRLKVALVLLALTALPAIGRAAEVMRKTPERSTLTTGYKLSQDQLKIPSMTINTGITGIG